MLFNKENILDINPIVFDASIAFKEIESQLINSDKLQIHILLRDFENAKKVKLLGFINLVTTPEIKAILKFSNIISQEIFLKDQRFKTNHFINEVIYDQDKSQLIIETAFTLQWTLNVSSDFIIELDTINNA